MRLVALTDEREIKRAIRNLKATVRMGAVPRRLVIHTPAGDSRCVVAWHEALPLWASIYIESRGTQYWCCYGMRDPGEVRRQRPIVQVNPPVAGKNTHCQGAFARDLDAPGDVYYLHTGHLGGGAVGVGKSAFLGSGVYDRPRVPVAWPEAVGGGNREMFNLGKLGDPHLVTELGAYVRAVAVFRVMLGKHGKELEKLFGVGGRRIFVSHSHADDAWCGEFVSALKKAGGQVWYDESNLGHGSLMADIQRELQACPDFVVVLSPNAVTSQFVEREVTAAILLRDGDPSRRIVPVVKTPCQIPPFWLEYRRVSGPGGQGLTPVEAAGRVIHALTSP